MEKQLRTMQFDNVKDVHIVAPRGMSVTDLPGTLRASLRLARAFTCEVENVYIERWIATAGMRAHVHMYLLRYAA